MAQCHIPTCCKSWDHRLGIVETKRINYCVTMSGISFEIKSSVQLFLFYFISERIFLLIHQFHFWEIWKYHYPMMKNLKNCFFHFSNLLLILSLMLHFTRCSIKFWHSCQVFDESLTSKQRLMLARIPTITVFSLFIIISNILQKLTFLIVKWN